MRCCEKSETNQNLTIEDSLKSDTGYGNGSSYKVKQLFNRHGYNLAILQGHVKGWYYTKTLPNRHKKKMT